MLVINSGISFRTFPNTEESMVNFRLGCCVVLIAAGLMTVGESSMADDRPRVDFVRDIRPIFAEHCLGCHSSKVHEAGLRLDSRESFFAGGDSGQMVIPNHSNQSLLIERLSDEDAGDIMPLDAKPLTARQIALISDWIDQGANWPEGVSAEIKHWAYVKPVQPELPQVTGKDWVQNPIDAFVLAKLESEGLQPSPRADKERLLRRVTLDLIGLPPTVAEMDAFLADDSPQAYQTVVDRLLASPRYGERWTLPWLDAARFADSNGYQRDGRREVWAYRDWVIDALNANLPFDQFTIEQIAGDLLPNPSLSQLIATGFHRGTMANVEAGTDPEEQRILAILDRVNTTGTVWLGITMQCAQCHDHKYDPFSQEDYYRLFAFFNNTEAEIETSKVNRNRDFVGPKIELPEPSEKTRARKRVDTEFRAVEKSLEALKAELAAHQTEWEQEVTKEQSELPEEIREILAVAADRRDEQQKEKLAEHFLGQFESVKQTKSRWETLKKQRDELAPETTLVMEEMSKPRETRLYKRGDFLSPVGEPLQPGTPLSLNPLQVEGQPSRLDLARWLVDEDNPLVARVNVNRYWAEFFGRGLVETPEDFGVQGTRPTHPLLLDWLATEFVRLGWNVKGIHRLIVTSAVYQQSSTVPPELLKRDPYNALYARGPRFRLRAELIRDNALAVAGLLSDKMHGPPVFPFQPEGVWNHVGRASNLWRTSKGEDLYRRGVYVNWRRTVPYPSFVNFDAPSREACVVKRTRSNTPLQALTLMNDPVYFEAAAGLAHRVLSEVEEADPEKRVRHAFRLATGRRPREAEVRILTNRYRQELDGYQRNPSAAEKLTKQWKPSAETSTAEYAAWLHVTNILLNLDEVITKG